MKANISLLPIINLEGYCEKGELIALNAGYEGWLYVLIAQKAPEHIFEQYAFSEGQLALKTEIRKETFYINNLQPLPVGKTLLVCPRTAYKGPGNLQKNGRIYDKEGILCREIFLGDGIRDVQVTNNGIIWTSFFDEGVFGTLGWDKPTGASGLVAWDLSGKQIYEFNPNNGLAPIVDCYALNVVSNENVWLYYYTKFPLVHLKSYKIEGVWDIPIFGSKAFAISEKNVVFQGGYGDENLYSLYKLSSKNFFLVRSFELLDEYNQKIIATRAIARGNRFWLLRNNKIYSFSVEDVLK